MVMKYAYVRGLPVYIMQRATRSLRKKKEIGKNIVVVQSLKTGDTSLVRKSSLKGITTKYIGKTRRKR